MTVVNTNVAALAAQTSMMKNTRELENAMAKLSSGHRINTASDDAAGISISDRLDSQIKGLSQAIEILKMVKILLIQLKVQAMRLLAHLQRLKRISCSISKLIQIQQLIEVLFNKEAQQLINEINRIGSEYTMEWNECIRWDSLLI